jgi:hypothetical protein
MTRYETHKRIVECCSKGHKTLEQITSYVNRGAKKRQSVPAISARRRDPIIRDLIRTDVFRERGNHGFYIANGRSLAMLDKRYGVKQ